VRRERQREQARREQVEDGTGSDHTSRHGGAAQRGRRKRITN
jgi:hypothetical protein